MAVRADQVKHHPEVIDDEAVFQIDGRSAGRDNSLFGGRTAAQAETVKITFLGVGDVYNFDGGKTRGGLARMNAVAKAEKAANPNTIYVFDGDMLSPSLLSGLDKGQNMIDLTNIVPFDLAVPATTNSTSARRTSSPR